MIRQLQSGDYCYCTNNVFLYYSGNLEAQPSLNLSVFSAPRNPVVPGHQQAGAPFRVEARIAQPGLGNCYDQTVAIRWLLLLCKWCVLYISDYLNNQRTVEKSVVPAPRNPVVPGHQQAGAPFRVEARIARPGSSNRLPANFCNPSPCGPETRCVGLVYRNGAVLLTTRSSFGSCEVVCQSDLDCQNMDCNAHCTYEWWE